MSLFSDIFQGGYSDAANAQITGLNSAYTSAVPNINAGTGVLNTDYAAALAPFTALGTTASAGTTALANALGLGGAAGLGTKLLGYGAATGFGGLTTPNPVGGAILGGNPITFSGSTPTYATALLGPSNGAGTQGMSGWAPAAPGL
jgi:hypothetical protein